jgi:hypothetical protein
MQAAKSGPATSRKRGKGLPVGSHQGDAWPHVLDMLDLGSICCLRQTSRDRRVDADAALRRLRSLCFGRLAKKVDCRTIDTLSTASSAMLVTINLASCKLLGDDCLRSLNQCASLSSLSLMACKQVSNDGLFHLFNGAHNFPELRSLNLNGCRRISTAGIVSVAQSRQQLTRLDCTGCSVTTTDHAMQALGDCCPQLRSLGLAGLNRLTDTGLLAIARGCTELQQLNLAGCEKLRLQFLRSRQAPAVPALHQAWQQQQQQPANADDTGSGSYWPHLSTLDLGLGARRWPSAGRLGSLASGGMLYCLDLSGCDKVTDEDVTDLVSASSPSGRLEAVLAEDAAPLLPGPALDSNVAAPLPYAVEANVSRLESFTARACSLGAPTLAALAAAASLCDVDMSSCFAVSDASVKRLLECCLGLRSLRLDECWELTDSTVHSILALRSPAAGPTAQSIGGGISGSTGGIDGAGGDSSHYYRAVPPFSGKQLCSRQLRFVSLVGCHRLTKQALRQFLASNAKKGRQLKVGEEARVVGTTGGGAAEEAVGASTEVVAGVIAEGGSRQPDESVGDASKEAVRLSWVSSGNQSGRFMLTREDAAATLPRTKRNNKVAAVAAVSGEETNMLGSPPTFQPVRPVGRVGGGKVGGGDDAKVEGRFCSAWRTGQTHAKQDVFHCYSCGLVGGAGCCRACAISCHRGHDVEWSHHGKFYCDCFYRSCCGSGAWH